MTKGESKTQSKQSKITGAQAVIASLEAEGVDIVFGYPGGQAIQIYDALYDSKQLHHVLARHEQGAVHEADGYARATGKIGVVLVTSGPGATNTVTGIATAYMDSIPLVIVTGQVPRTVIGTDSFQESDIVGITLPVVKHSFLVKSAADIARTFKEAFHIAKTGRPGPVLVDVPSDVAAELVTFSYPSSVNIPSYRPTYKGNARQTRSAAKLIVQAERPVLYVGGGVVASQASQLVCRLAREYHLPVVTTLMAKGAVPASEPLNFGSVGMHGSKYANRALNRADLIIAVGARFSDRVTGNPDTFAPHAKVIHIDIDPAEIGKVRAVQVPIVGDVSMVLDSLLEELESTGSKPETQAWVDQLNTWRTDYPILEKGAKDYPGLIVPEVALAKLSTMLDPHNSIVVTEVGQNQMWAAQFISREEPRTFLSSGGLGTMGYGLPAAIGAAIAFPEKDIVLIAGDGSLQMNSQEMATAAVNGAAVKVVLLNNSSLGMVRQWQRLFYEGRYSSTELPDNPNFVKLAEAYSWQAERVDKPEQVEEAFKRMLVSKVPYLIDMKIDPNQSVFPMVAPGSGLAEAIGAVGDTGKEQQA